MAKTRTKFILIQKCSYDKAWYSDKVGETMLVLMQYDTGYCAKSKSGHIDHVLKTDAVDITERMLSQYAD